MESLGALILVSTSERVFAWDQVSQQRQNCTCGLHADDLDVRPDPLDVRCNACNQSAASHRHEYCRHSRRVVHLLFSFICHWFVTHI